MEIALSGSNFLSFLLSRRAKTRRTKRVRFENKVSGSLFILLFRILPVDKSIINPQNSTVMFSIHIKGQRDPNQTDMVKLSLIFYKSGCIRSSKVICISGAYDEWDQKAERFLGKSPEYTAKNKLLQRERLKYLKVAEKWESEQKNWIAKELCHYYDQQEKSRNRYTTVSEMIDKIVNTLCRQERFKNSRVLMSESTAENYTYLKKALYRFIQCKYHRDFSKYMFRDIDEKFLRAFTLYEQQRGALSGNNGGIQQKLKTFRATCAKAKDEGIYGVNLAIFIPFKRRIKSRFTTPKALPHDTIQRIEQVDRSILKRQENLFLDLFLFSYYACGMSPIDICFLERDRIKGDTIVYERIKLDRVARVLLIDKAAEIIERYRTESYMNYVFPVFKWKKMDQAHMYATVSRVGGKVNSTLQKICDHLGIREKVYWSSARSSFISKMIDEGYHPLQVAEQVGNSPQTI